MEIQIKRVNDAFLMRAENENGHSILMDAGKQIGGGEEAPRPMQLLLMALGGCSSIDVISILRKQRQEIRDFLVTINGERDASATPALFRKIHIKFTITGDVDQEKAERAVKLSMDTYCSVARILEKSADISYSVIVEKQ